MYKWYGMFVLMLATAQSLAFPAFEFSDRSDTWIRMVPSLDQVSQSCAMVLNDQDLPMICYGPSAAGNQGLYFAWFDGTEWNETLVEPLQYTSTNCRMVRDDDGVISVLYSGTMYNSLRFARFDGTEWQTEEIWGDKPNSYDFTLDSQGNPHVAYVTDPDNSLIYAVREGTGWTAESIGHCGTPPIAIAVDSQDRPHLIWSASGNQTRHGWPESGVWNQESVSSGIYCYGMDLYADESDALHLAMTGVASGNLLVYSCRQGSGWSSETVDSMKGGACSIITGQDGRVHIAYAETINSDMRYAVKSGGAWSTQVVSWQGMNGYGISLVLNSLGDPCMLNGRYTTQCELVWWGDDVGVSQDEFLPVPEAARLLIEPNPASAGATVRVHTDRAGSYSLDLFDLTGRLVITLFSGTLSVGESVLSPDLGGLPDGTYHLVLGGEGLRKTARMVLLP